MNWGRAPIPAATNRFSPYPPSPNQPQYNYNVAGLAGNVGNPNMAHSATPPPPPSGSKSKKAKAKVINTGETWSQQRADAAKANLLNMGATNKPKPLSMMRHVQSVSSHSMTSFLKTRELRETKPTKQKAKPTNAVWVKNVCFKARWEALKEHMASAGHVETATILKDLWGKSQGTACVRYSTEEEAKRAIEALNDTMFEERPLKIEPWTGALPPVNGQMVDMASMVAALAGAGSWRKPTIGSKKMEGDPATMVHVTDVKPSVKDPEFKEHMGKAGTVEDFRRAKWSARVRYSTPEEAAKAVSELNGSSLDDKPIKVDTWVDGWVPPEEQSAEQGQGQPGN